jgi:hypothetical protein
VTSFRELVDAVESAQSNVLFCPFTIDKPEDFSLTIKSAVDIECSVFHLCKNRIILTMKWKVCLLVFKRLVTYIKYGAQMVNCLKLDVF